MIKELRKEDFPVFFELMGEVEFSRFDMNNSRHVAWLNKRIDELYYVGAKFYGYFDDEKGTPIGFTTILIEERPEGICPSSCELIEIGVVKEYRHGGYGSKLIKYAEQVAKENGVYCMYMHTYAGDYDVIAFYGKNGFIPVATLPDVYGPDSEGMVYMRKILR